jgi:hypothetical protein
MERKYLAGLSVLAVLLVASSAYAFQGFGQGNDEMQQALEAGDYDAFVAAMSHQVSEQQFQRMAEMHQNRAQEQQALEAEDYAAWVQAIESRPRITDLVTEENFPKYAEMQKARQSGDFETAQALAEELGLNQFGFGKGPMGRPHPMGKRMKGFGQGPCFQGNGEGSE